VSDTTLFVGISELVQPHACESTGRSPVAVIPDAALLVRAGRIVAAGPRGEVEIAREAQNAAKTDLEGRAVVPGLVDSHTHVLFAGDRIDEMSRRARGETYESIAKAGGGIRRSVEPLRATGIEELVAQTRPRLTAMLARGTTTLEAKSGYGLSPEAELKQLRAIQALRQATPIDILPTLLAHVIPQEARDNRRAYVERFCREVVPIAAHEGLARFCDVYVESVAFTPDEARQIAAAARVHGLGLRLHVDQLADGGGAQLAAELGAVSADHLEFTGMDGRRALAAAGVVATILPGCALFLGNGPWPNGRGLRDAGCEVAVATDCNPGSSMVTDLALVATLAATRCGLSLEEALWGVTQGGARALNLSDRGRLVRDELADFVVVDHVDWRALLYWPGGSRVHRVYKNGERVWPGKSLS
jgi:imidazolonepropionase